MILVTASPQVQLLVMPSQRIQEIYHLLATKSYRKFEGNLNPVKHEAYTAWAVRVWKEWADERNSKAPANEKVELDICKVGDVEL